MKVLVTGSTRGLGLALLGAFFVDGYDVVMNGRNKIHTDHNALWKDAEYITVKDFEALGVVDFVVNNAFDKNDCKRSMFSQGIVLKYALEYFKKHKICGTIININSVSAINQETTDYAKAKIALRDYSISLKKDANNNGITIIDVYPGAIKTDWTKDRDDWNDLIDPQELASFIVDLVKPSSFYVDEVVIRRPKCLQKEENR